MANTVDTIVAFLKGKGLPAPAIAGILGNMQVESSFGTSALNQGEGAIGLVQWEGGRRQALQQYAAAHGLSETDINAQLGYLWQELSGPYSGVLQQLKSATTAGQAAAIFDSSYEVSSGSSRTQRISDANNFAASGLSSAGFTSQSANLTALSSGTGTATMSPADIQKNIQAGAGDLYTLATQIPELKGILQTAISKGWDKDEFTNAIDNTAWYKSHAQSVRTLIAQKVSDPATYTQTIQNQQRKIMQMAAQLGVPLPAAEITSLANQSLLNSWTDQTLQGAIGKNWKGHGAYTGQAATDCDQVKQLAANYGVPLSTATANAWTQKLLTGADTIDGFTEYAKNVAKSLYPALAKQLDTMDMKTIADPYVQTKANLLEVDPNTINWSADPTIKKALQGTGATANGGEPTATPLWQFEQQVKADPKWQYTVNAHQDTSQVLMQLGKAWGYEA